MFELEVDGEEWRYAFLQADGCLGREDREHLIRETVRLYRKSGRKVDIRGENFEGRIERGEYVALGTLDGYVFNAQLETNKGKRDAAIIVQESFDLALN